MRNTKSNKKYIPEWSVIEIFNDGSEKVIRKFDSLESAEKSHFSNGLPTYVKETSRWGWH